MLASWKIRQYFFPSEGSIIQLGWKMVAVWTCLNHRIWTTDDLRCLVFIGRRFWREFKTLWVWGVYTFLKQSLFVGSLSACQNVNLAQSYWNRFHLIYQASPRSRERNEHSWSVEYSSNEVKKMRGMGLVQQDVDGVLSEVFFFSKRGVSIIGCIDFGWMYYRGGATRNSNLLKQ